MPPKKRKTLDPVHPNAGVRVWYQGHLERLIREMALEMRRDLVKAWNGSPEIIGDAPSKPKIDLLQRALDNWGGLWTRRLETLSDRLARQFANKNHTVTDAALRASFAKAGLTIQFRPTPRMLNAQRP
jgi:hypothetical protein